MREKIKQAFDQVQAEDGLKHSTSEYIFYKTRGYTQTKAVNYKRVLSVAACLLLLFLGGRQFYFIPTVKISIDINPSMELGVNRFDRIVSVEGYNDDGKNLADELDIKFMDYKEAVDRIMENREVEALLSRNEIMTISVAGKNEVQSTEILSNIESCTEAQKNTHCYYASSEEVEQAHEAGLSHGRYRAFLELRELDSDITAEELQNMSMREIWDMIEELSGNESDSFSGAGGKHRQTDQDSLGRNHGETQIQNQDKNCENGNLSGNGRNEKQTDRDRQGRNHRETQIQNQDKSCENGNLSGNGRNEKQADQDRQGRNEGKQN